MTNPITKVATTDLSDMLDPQGGQRMILPGFDDEFIELARSVYKTNDRRAAIKKEINIKY